MQALTFRFAAILLATTILSTAAEATPVNLVKNGGFEQTTMSQPSEISRTNVANWSSTGYNFIFSPGSAATYVTRYNSYLGLAGMNGHNFISPNGGNFVAADGVYQVGALTQTIHNLSIGQSYTLTFDWAAAEQQGWTDPTTEFWTASLGNQSFTTSTVHTPSQGFTGWMAQSFTYKATSADEVLSFLAGGTPMGEPPFALLDGVSLTANSAFPPIQASAVPEPAGWGVLAAGMVLLGMARLRNRYIAGPLQD